MLTYIFYGLFILACAVLVLTILLQPGKADAGALFAIIFNNEATTQIQVLGTTDYVPIPAISISRRDGEIPAAGRRGLPPERRR